MNLDAKALEAAARALCGAQSLTPWNDTPESIDAKHCTDTDRDDYRIAAEECIVAYLSALEAAGFRVVPVEPTEEMCRAGENSVGGSSSAIWIGNSYMPENVELIYKDMIASAPPSIPKQGEV